jgi:tripartite-type tricarboxylate transporter receptor subunit TctC
LAIANVARAEDWPTRPVTLIIPFAAGGPGDAVGRVLAPRLAEVLGQSVVIENVGGAGGMTALNRLAKAPPDGYTMSVGNSGTHTFSQILYKAPLYNAVTDFTPVSMITEGGYALIARKDLPAHTLPEFIAYAKDHQATMQFGSAGIGSGTHIVCALLNKAIGVDVTHVPYRATSLATHDLIAGRIDYICDAIATARPQIEGKTVTAIAVLWPGRSPVLPNVPTADEQGLKGFSESSWNAIFLPKDAPQPIVQRLNAALAATLDTQAVRGRMDLLGVNVATPERRGPEYLAKFVAAEIPKWGPILKAIGVSGNR